MPQSSCIYRSFTSHRHRMRCTAAHCGDAVRRTSPQRTAPHRTECERPIVPGTLVYRICLCLLLERSRRPAVEHWTACSTHVLSTSRLHHRLTSSLSAYNTYNTRHCHNSRYLSHSLISHGALQRAFVPIYTQQIELPADQRPQVQHNFLSSDQTYRILAKVLKPTLYI